MFEQILALVYLRKTQHKLILRQEQHIKDQARSIKDLKKRISDLLELSPEELRSLRSDNYVRELERGRNEAMNKLRKSEQLLARHIRR